MIIRILIEFAEMFVFLLISAYLVHSSNEATFENVTVICDIVGGWLPVPINSSNYLKSHLPKKEKILKISFVHEDVIPILSKNSIKNLKSLVRLDLSDHAIEEIEQGALRNLPRLKILLVEKNSLREIRRGVFNCLKNVATISLEGNLIAQISPQAFDNLNNLEVLNIRDNNLKKIFPLWFENKPKLNFVHLQNNVIGTIPNGALANFTKTIFLDGNRIRKISRRIFGGTKEIFRLSLADNHIEYWRESLLAGVRIMFFDISYNRVHCLSGNFTNFFVAKITYLDGNPWNCDSLKTVSEWVKQHDSVHVQMDTSVQTCSSEEE